MIASAGGLHRDAVRVTWSALRGRALWPGWQEPQDGETVSPTQEAAGRVWAALLERDEVAGLTFGCGTYVDADGDEREAACRVTGAQVLLCPEPGPGDSGEVVALVDIESETPHGPNAFALGRELKRRLSWARWEYAPGSVADMQVVRVEAYANQAGAARWLPIHPERSSLL